MVKRPQEWFNGGRQVLHKRAQVRNKTPLIIYHRGRHGEDIGIEENTIQAFERAIKDGARMVEFDVGAELKIAHDPDPGLAAPTLEEAMGVICARCAVNIEIKSPRAVPGLARLLDNVFAKGRWRKKQIVLSSFHHQTALLMKRLFPKLCVGVVNDGVLLPAYIDMLGEQGIDNIHMEHTNVVMDTEGGHKMRSALLQNNMHIWVWTVNTASIYDAVIKYGAEAVFTDKPQLLR